MVDLKKALIPQEYPGSRIQGLRGGGWLCMNFFSHVHGEPEGRAMIPGFEEVSRRLCPVPAS